MSTIVRSALVIVALTLWAGVAAAQETQPPPPTGHGPGAPTQWTLDEARAALASPDPATRINAVRSLANLGASAPLADISGVLASDPASEVRGWAARAMAQIGTPQSIQALQVAAQRDPDERVRALANELLGTATPAPAPAVAPVEATGVAPAPVAAPVAQPQVVVVPQPVVQTAPPAQRRSRRAGLGMRIAGWSVFGVFYGVSFITGASLASADPDGLGWTYMLPVVGPAIMGTRMFRWAGDSDTFGEQLVAPLAVFLGIISWLDAIAQGVGVGLIAGGYARRSRARREEAATTAADRRGWTLAMSGPGDGPGVTFAAWF